MDTISLPQCRPVRLEKTTIIKSFDCGDADLNEFLLKDSFNYLGELLAVTYLFEFGNSTVSFYSVLNDKISIEELETKSALRRFLHCIPSPKRYKSVPAVKIGRLGVDKHYHKQGIGSQMLDLIKMSFTHKNKTGCRFITVDAYRNDITINFYKKNGFEFLTAKDVNEKTRLMYFDLITFVDPEPSSQPS